MGKSELSDTLRDRVEHCVPVLRRYARALLGGRGRAGIADDLVRTAVAGFRPRPNDSTGGIRTDLFGDLVSAIRHWHAANPGDGDGSRRAGGAPKLETLPFDQREVMLLVVLERFSYDDAAAILGLPRSSVVARLVRARGALTGVDDDAPHRPTHLRLVK